MDEGRYVTAKIKVAAKAPLGAQTQVSFLPDYQDGRNKEWAAATPALSLSLTMLTQIADLFEVGEAIDMTLSRSSDQGTLQPGSALEFRDTEQH